MTPLFRRDDRAGVATVTLTSAATRNALSLYLIDALNVAFDEIAKDPAAKVAVIAAEGPAFSSGHDLREIHAHSNDPDRGAAFYEQLFDRCSDFMRGLTEHPKPVIAAVEGIATAAGCQLVAACDLAVAGAKARFSLPGARNGGFCSTPLVAVGRAVSRKHAMELALTAEFIDAERAEAFGLVNRVVPEGQALASAQALATTIASRPSSATALGKRTFYEQIDMPLGQAYARASRAMVESFQYEDAFEGRAAFLEKRPPKWANP
ncbi:MAG: enoyl-CoA hydratase [Pseudomonadota bacterium]|nr:enoyl-CoA hydratase [Pseudomonadota bacterium]